MEDKFDHRWGIPALDSGFTQIPNFVLWHYAELGVTPTEFTFIMHLACYKFNSPKGQASPSLQTVAKQMGISTRTVQRIRSSLEDKHYLLVIARSGRTSVYNFQALTLACLELETVAKNVAPVTTTHDTCVTPPMTHVSPKEEEVKKKKKEKIAEAAISPPDDPLWPTNSNFPPREETTEEKPITATDPLTLAAECASRSEGKKSWTVTAEAGGADPYQDGPLKAACAILRIDPDSLAEEEKRTWARQLKRITKAVKGGTPRLFVEACKAWSSAYEWKGKSGAPYSNVFRGAFPDDLQMLMRQVKSGTVPTSEVRISN